jgi:tellurite resistance protein TerC
LRSLYFLLAKMIDRFIYLKSGLAIVLGFVGGKMILRDFIEVPTVLSLTFIIGVLAATIGISMIATSRKNSPPAGPPPQTPE